MNEIVVTLKHQRKAKMCVNGTELFFKKHGLNYKDYCRNGINAELLWATNDAMAQRLCKIAGYNNGW